jgi:phosphoenolpyruvate carboxykinase (ATP)
MHCGANETRDGFVTLFFGLSGTGKTTLSTDENVPLIGDDGHAWGPRGVCNLADGSYAKLHGIREEEQQTIWTAVHRFGAIMENVDLDDARHPLFEKGPENIRGAYPLSFIGNAVPGGCARHPSAIVMLTCDLYGVLPPVAALTDEQALFHYLAGYTTKVGSTESDSTAAFQPTLSAFFGEPFFPLKPAVYLALFSKLIKKHKVPVYLVNTGFTGGPAGRTLAEHPEGRRFTIITSRRIIHAIQRGEVQQDRLLPEHGLWIPGQVAGVQPRNLNPRLMWSDTKAYLQTVAKVSNYITRTVREKFPDIPENILAAGPPETR